MEEGKCGFCHTGDETNAICGTLHKDKVDGKTIVAHHKCMQYSAMLVQYKFEEFGGFKKQEVLKEIHRGNRLACYLCKKEKSKKKNGAASGCSLSSCRKTFHYYCVAMNPDTVAKRYRVAAGNKVVILYRVFCSKAHEEKYRKNISAEDIVGKNTSEDEGNDDEEDEEDKRSGSGGGDRTSPDNTHAGDEEEDENDDEPAKKKQKTNDEANDDESGPDSPGMSAKEIILETQRQYKALQERNRLKSQHIARDNGYQYQDVSIRSIASPRPSNGMSCLYDSADDLSEGFNTSNNGCLDDSESSRSDFSLFSLEKHPQGCTLVIPSKLDVDFNSLCKVMGLQPASCVFWPSSNKMKGLQDRHMYYCMWDILSHLRNKDADGIGSLLRSVCCEKYECFYNFDVHNSSSTIRSKLEDVCAILHNQQDLQACRLDKVTHKDKSLDVLIVSLSRTMLRHLDSLILYLWTAETFRTKYDDNLSFLSQEKKIISSWLLPRLQDKTVELSVYPKDDTIRRSYNRKTCSVARDIEFRVENLNESFKDSAELVRVTVIRNIDDGLVQFRSYVQKLILSILQQTVGFESYCVLDLQQTPDIRCVYDLIPLNIMPQEFSVYSAFNPGCTPVSCVVIHRPKDAKLITEDFQSSSPLLQESIQTPEDSERFSLYMDVDEVTL